MSLYQDIVLIIGPIVLGLITWFIHDLITSIRDSVKACEKAINLVKNQQIDDGKMLTRLAVQNETLLEKINNVMAHQAAENDVVGLMKSEIQKIQKIETEVQFLVDNYGKIITIIDKIVHKK